MADLPISSLSQSPEQRGRRDPELALCLENSGLGWIGLENEGLDPGRTWWFYLGHHWWEYLGKDRDLSYNATGFHHQKWCFRPYKLGLNQRIQWIQFHWCLKMGEYESYIFIWLCTPNSWQFFMGQMMIFSIKIAWGKWHLQRRSEPRRAKLFGSHHIEDIKLFASPSGYD